MIDLERTKQLNDACGTECGHSDGEHKAFDLGLYAGEMYGRDAVEPVFPNENLLDAWQTGHSVGCLNRA